MSSAVMLQGLFNWLLVAGLVSCVTDSKDTQPISSYHDYCVLGAGPSGLQMGCFLEKQGRDYIVLERSDIPGSFFQRYPRHNRLISINKQYTGKSNKEFNLRHDWNSLLSDDDTLLFRHYSSEFYPHRESMLHYLKDFTSKLGIKVKYGTEIISVHKFDEGTSWYSHQYKLIDKIGNHFSCSVLLVATGLWVPHIINFPGSEHLEGYESISVDAKTFVGQTVLILGKGNSAFETATNLLGVTNHIHLYSRSPVRLAWETHYVGDLRAFNNELLDTYQLKSLDGLVEGSLEELAVLKDNQGQFHLTLAQLLQELNVSTHAVKHGLDSQTLMALLPSYQDDNFSMRRPYNRIIRCLGFEFDFSLFRNGTKLTPVAGGRKKYPRITPWYEAVNDPGIFVIGTASHSIDHRKSAGGFIHGFRYTVRAVHHILEKRHHGNVWPTTVQPTSLLLKNILRRLNEASGIYQMFSVLGDVVLMQSKGSQFKYLEEFPLLSLPKLEDLSGHQVEPSGLFVINMEYGKNLSNVLGKNRAVNSWKDAWHSNFLHPVIYFYKTLPTESEMRLRPQGWPLPRPQAIHPIVEDFLTEWCAPVSHIQPLRRFLENCLGTDLRTFYAETCFKHALISKKTPLFCQQGYLKGQGLLGNKRLWQHAVDAGLMDDYRSDTTREQPDDNMSL
ncbi:FAD-dependent oxidoreductase domain-containing protein 2 [Erpetoichthys calabaricus]|uniref:FAD-dependent oxidoreductase domain containing 2 n=1 Tax=Erpetoichthys calabaricus TaxID=27687 RepID=A0A8C4SJH1_ERPCA|nr:FAD-dependent oxidoreductase domain-containing protein 2 [Erpetoichthys calabaricus]XP_028671412.1 FAD-dependent oxidoreductase domain-containing protein 2 [Erpetoichthys calabaricus]XP_051790481.1 FAD-dependent oxidoreductase domain-containing protein 2 [Erpetoichthys calabaricus]